MAYFLIFSSHFNRDKGIDMGRLSLNHIELGTIRIWKAYSSHEKGQEIEGFHARNAYLPPQYRLKNTSKYSVDLKPINLSHIKGVSGNFYRILPYQIVTDKGYIRGDFGIHYDGGAIGSHGCIVMDKKRFKELERELNFIFQKGIRKISLFVQYS